VSFVRSKNEAAGATDDHHTAVKLSTQVFAYPENQTLGKFSRLVVVWWL